MVGARNQDFRRRRCSCLRLHVARALAEAGLTENLKSTFSRYIYDGGPANSRGREPNAEEAVELIRKTGGVAVLAHPWALKKPVSVIRRLTEAGLRGIEAYRSDGKLAVYSDLAEAYGLVKLGGSDYQGRGGQQGFDVGSVSLPMSSVHEFLKLARPIWLRAIIDILENYVKDPSEVNLQFLFKFGKLRLSNNFSALSSANDLISHCLSLWLTKEQKLNPEIEAINLKLSNFSINHAMPETRAGRT